jgi:hypothetical protein
MKISNRLNFVIAGDNRQVVEKENGPTVWRQLADNGFVERTSVSAVGFHRNLEEDSLTVVLPKAFSASPSRALLGDRRYQREQIFRLIRVFKKIRRDSRYKLNRSCSSDMLLSPDAVNDPVLDSFDAALKLRRDYRENGLYRRKAAARVRNNPSYPIDWDATIRSEAMDLSSSAISLTSTLHFGRKQNDVHPLHVLQAQCLKEIFSLTGERHDLPETPDSLQKSFLRVKSQPSAFIRNLRSTVFDERGRLLIEVINAYLGESKLRSIDQATREELLSFSQDFELIWEAVLRDLLAPNLDERALAAGEWHPWGATSAIDGIRPEIDIRFSENDVDVLVDAKDYRLINGSRWMGSSGDYYKQLIYEKLIAKSGGSTTLNILAFPCTQQPSMFSIRGCHLWREIPSSRVYEISVDYDLSIKTWLKETSLDMRNEIDTLVCKLREFGRQLDSR